MAFPNPPDPYIGEIRLFAGFFAPKNWAICDGKVLKISDNQPLFNVIGFNFGGDSSTFALPDLRGRVPISIGLNFSLGNKGGKETVSLDLDEMPVHSHVASTNTEGGNDSPANNFWGYSTGNPYLNPATGQTAMNTNSLLSVGEGSTHENRIPYQAINYIISLQGVPPF